MREAEQALPRRIVLVLSLAGLASALITILFLWVSIYLIFFGIVFGLVISACLGKLGLFSERQSGWFIGTAAVAHGISFYLVVRLSLIAPPMSNPDDGSPLAFLVGGVLGGFLVVGALPLILNMRTGRSGVLSGALAWAIGGAALGGGLAVIGIVLGPSLGAGIVDSLQVLHLLPFHGNTRALPPKDWYSLYLVWQTGVGLMLGIVANRYVNTGRTEENANG